MCACGNILVVEYCLSFFQLTLYCGLPGTNDWCSELINTTETGLAIFETAQSFKIAYLHAKPASHISFT
jgi:hypothetical protein